MKICKRYYALKDALGFPIPGTMRGYDKDPCRCELVELVAVSGEPDAEAERRYHPNGLHYFYQVDSSCRVLPNSLIAAKQRPKGRFVEFTQFIGTETDGGTESLIYTIPFTEA